MENNPFTIGSAVIEPADLPLVTPAHRMASVYSMRVRVTYMSCDEGDETSLCWTGLAALSYGIEL